MSSSKRKPARRREAAAERDESKAGKSVVVNGSGNSLAASVAKFSSRPVAESPWGQQGLAEIQLDGERHFRPERLPSSRKERPKSARLTNLYGTNVDYLQSVADTLRVLDLSSTGLFAFPQQLAEGLANIETLILDNNAITNDGFPQCFKDLMSLNVLSVRRNRLTSIPPSWSFLFEMRTLYADENQIASLKYLDRMNKLRILSLQGNALQELPREFYSLKKLEYLNLSNNSISAVGMDVKRWINIKELDLSYNKLTFLIPDIFLLPKLEGLQLSHNEVAKIPTVMLKTKDKRLIHSVDLSYNCLTRFPENVFSVSASLDLTSNSIKVINNSAFKKLEWRTSKQLCVQDNPLNTPPREVCEGGLRSMLQYYFETKVDSKVYQGIKIFLLGQQGCGKSSLLQSFLDQQPRLTASDEETIGIEIYDYQIDTKEDPADPKPLSLSLWDCSGHQGQVQYILPLLHTPSLALIMFDLTSYSRDTFHEQIGQWIDLLTLRNNKAVFILVGTKADLCPKKKLKPSSVLEGAQKDTEEYLKAYIDSIDHEIACIERLDQISTAFNEQYRQYLNLKNFKPLFHPEALVTSSSKMLGFERLEAVLVDLAAQTKTFPSVMRVIPALWADVDNYLEDYAQNQFIISMPDLEAMVHKLFALRHLTGQICQYMHESGKAVFCEKEESFKDAVVLQPASLFEFTRLVFRADLEAFLTDPADKEEIKERFLKTKSENDYSIAVQLATQRGILTQQLIKSLWGTGKRRFNLVNYLCDNLKWCYRIGSTIGKPENGSLPRFNLNFDIEQNDDGTVKTDMFRVNLLAPSLVTCSEPEEAQAAWTDTTFRIVAAYRFTRFQPLMFFEKLLVTLHSEHLRFAFHWRNGLLAYHSANSLVWLRVTLDDPEDKSYLVTLSCGLVTSEDTTSSQAKRHELLSSGNQAAAEASDAHEQDDDEQAENDGDDQQESGEKGILMDQAGQVWKCLLLGLHNAERLLKQYPAAWFRREVRCPVCEEMIFWGEWLSPKEAQELEFKTCRGCHSEVRTCMLVQPRMQKRQAAARPAAAAAVKAAATVSDQSSNQQKQQEPPASNAGQAEADDAQLAAKQDDRRKSVTFLPTNREISNS